MPVQSCAAWTFQLSFMFVTAFGGHHAWASTTDAIEQSGMPGQRRQRGGGRPSTHRRQASNICREASPTPLYTPISRQAAQRRSFSARSLLGAGSHHGGRRFAPADAGL